MKSLKYYILIILSSFTSCTIVQEYHFNRDFSGNTRITIDMGSMIQMMSGLDSSGNSSNNIKDSLDFIFTQSSGQLKNMGIKNLKYGWEEGSNVLYMSYDFDNIEQLNMALNASNQQNSAFANTINKEPHTYFSRQRKTLVYNGLKSNKDISKTEIESMSDYYQYSLLFSFDRKIKSVDNPNVKLTPDHKKAELSGSMFKIIRPDFNSNITFKLK